MLSIIIINYNTWQLTAELCRNILRLNDGIAKEILVVDNDSKGYPPEFYSTTEGVTLLPTGKNLGFAGGINFGVSKAQHEYICVLNSDIFLDENKDFFGPLIARLKDEKVGLISPKIIYKEDSTIQFAGFYPIHKITGRGFARGYHQKDKGQYDTAEPTSRAHGAAMLFKKSIWEKLGGIKEDYFLYYEEMDFSEKVKKLGYEIWYEPASTALHFGSYSIAENATPKLYYIFRNRIWYLKENTSFWCQILSLPYLLAVGYTKAAFYLLKGDKTRFSYIFRGTNHGLFS